MKKLFLFVIITTLLISCKKEPSADFSYLGKPEVGVNLHFTNLSSNSDSFSWDFGDGTVTTEESPAHAFAKPGNYIVSLTVRGHGKSITASKTLKITGTTFTITNNTSAGLYDFFTFHDNGHYIEEYYPLGFLNQGQTTQIIKTDYNKISFGFKFVEGGNIFINVHPYRLNVGAHNELVITDTISIIMVTITSGFLKDPGHAGILSVDLEKQRMK